MLWGSHIAILGFRVDMHVIFKALYYNTESNSVKISKKRMSLFSSKRVRDLQFEDFFS